MCHLRYVLECQLDLCAELLLDLLQVHLLEILHHRLAGISLVRTHHRIEISVLIHEGRAAGERPPFHILPFAGDGKVYADVKAGMLLKHLCRLREPCAYRHDFDRACDAVDVCVYARDVS